MRARTRISGKFNEADEFCAAAAGWDIEFQQLDCGKLDATLDVAIGRKFLVQNLYLGRRFHQRGAAPDGLLTFGLPQHPEKLTWHGKIMRDPIINFSRPEGYDCVSDSDFQGHTFSIGSDAIEDAVSALHAPVSAEQICNTADHFAASSDAVMRIRSLAYGLFHCTEDEKASKEAFDELEADLSHVIAKSICGTPDLTTTTSFAQRQLAVDKALELILSTQDAITVSDVYAYSGVSWRTLDRAFKESFGVTPKQYIVATRMVGVRRTLLAAPTGTKITAIAQDWGFWHLGRFSSDYKHMFGELPSATLRRTA